MSLPENNKYDDLRQLINNPKESLQVELKSWFDPQLPEGKSKIAKACIALFNNDGGYLLIGFDNRGNPDSSPLIEDLEIVFHHDVIQEIITKYASSLFEITVHIMKRDDGNECVVISVPGGVRTPVYSKAGIPDGKGKDLLRSDKVFVRSLDSNGTVSSAEPRGRDWERFMEVCFDNREADIGRFVRRHLSIEQLKIISDLFNQLSQPQEYDPTEKANLFLDLGFTRFTQIVSDRQVSLPPHGSWEISFVLNGEFARKNLDEQFLDMLQVNNPRLTGWPMWVDSRSFSDPEDRPFTFQGAWEALIINLGASDLFHGIDFWRIQPDGRFYQYRALEDDIRAHSRKPSPLKGFEFSIPIFRMAEAIAVGIAFAKALECSGPDCGITMISRWKSLKGRELVSWVDFFRNINEGRISREDEVISTITIPIDTPKSRIHNLVAQSLKPLYSAFNGFSLGDRIIEEIADKALNRK